MSTSAARTIYQTAEKTYHDAITELNRQDRQLRIAKTSPFPVRARTAATALATCLGDSPTAPTTAELAQLAGFLNEKSPNKLGASRSISQPAPTEEAYDSATTTLESRTLVALQIAQAEDELTTSIQIVSGEVAFDLYGIAATLSPQSRTITARYVYATTAVGKTFQNATNNVGTVVSNLTQDVKRHGPDSIPAPATKLINTLTAYATACASVINSSNANVPKPVVTVSGRTGSSYARPGAGLPTLTPAPGIDVDEHYVVILSFVGTAEYEPSCDGEGVIIDSWVVYGTYPNEHVTVNLGPIVAGSDYTGPYTTRVTPIPNLGTEYYIVPCSSE
ncbi:MAG TPA: hypothetical protein VHZ98_09175 [Galbitalea sp.]|nr:hypothetical protein [Galbitalea sp.]